MDRRATSPIRRAGSRSSPVPTAGSGYATALELARAGATVVLACRDTPKGERAQAAIRQAAPAADTRLADLDLADLGSVRAFAANLVAQQPHLDVLINNAGVMAPPRRLTADGFESQIGTNHLGHFALTGLLAGSLLAAEQPRVVTLSSGVHRIGRMNFDDLQSERRYINWLAYGQSKLANLLFCFELQRRATEAGTALRERCRAPRIRGDQPPVRRSQPLVREGDHGGR